MSILGFPYPATLPHFTDEALRSENQSSNGLTQVSEHVSDEELGSLYLSTFSAASKVSCLDPLSHVISSSVLPPQHICSNQMGSDSQCILRPQRRDVTLPQASLCFSEDYVDSMMMNPRA